MTFAASFLIALLQSTSAAGSAQVIGGDDAQACSRAAASSVVQRADETICERAASDLRLSDTDRTATQVNYGIVLRKRGRANAALAAHDRALAMAPDLAEAWLNRAAALADLDRDDEALTALNRALALDLAAPQVALLNRALILERRGDARAAYADLQAALALDPEYAPALEALAAYDVVMR